MSRMHVEDEMTDLAIRLENVERKMRRDPESGLLLPVANAHDRMRELEKTVKELTAKVAMQSQQIEDLTWDN